MLQEEKEGKRGVFCTQCVPLDQSFCCCNTADQSTHLQVTPQSRPTVQKDYEKVHRQSTHCFGPSKNGNLSGPCSPDSSVDDQSFDDEYQKSPNQV